MSSPEFIESKENYEIAVALQEKYFPFIGYVDLSLIYFAEMDGYKSKNAPIYQMTGMTQKWARTLLLSLGERKSYCLSVWSEQWQELEKTKKEWIIFKCLFMVSPQGNGKIRPFDVSDYGFIVEYFVRLGVGPYWEVKEGLPSLLSGDVLPLVLPLNEE